MTKRMLIDATHAEETRVVVLDGSRLEDFDVETAAKRQLKGNIYLAKVVRVEPSLQAAFVEYGGGRHGFLAFAEIHPDYYQIPVADRQRLLEQQEAEARAEEEADDAAAEAAARGEEPQPAAIRHEAEVPDEPEHGEHAEHTEPGHTETEHAEAGHAETEHAEAEHTEAGHAESAPEADAPADAADTPLIVAAADEDSEPPLPMEEEAPRSQAAAIDQEFVQGREEFAEETEAAAEAEATAEPAEAAAAAADYGAEAPAAAEAATPEAVWDDAEAPAAEPHPVTAEGAEPAALPVPQAAGGAVPASEAHDDEPREARAPSRFLRSYKIQEVIRRRQILLIQVVKEERGTKGAALTTYISLAGRFSVLMPNSPRGGGISRKITSATDRRRLKEVMAELQIPRGMGMIVRTAGANRPRAEIRRDCEYLLELWDSIRETTMASIAPALIHEEASLIKRSIRDNYSAEVEEVLVDGEAGWKAARDFMRMLMPSHARKVILWNDAQPLFAHQQVEAQLDSMLVPTVQLRSGGYLVINQTEALVAIDVNSGRSTRERGIEETALKTNLEAADEVARQLRLRDLAGLIVIDFIDMESRRNNAAVERRMKDALKDDRARIQIGSISSFGLMEMSRQRLRPSLAETNFTTCPHCGGTGLVRSTETSALAVLRAIEDEGAKRRASAICVHVAGAVALYILNHKRTRIQEIEARYGMSVEFAADETLLPPATRIEKLRAAVPGEALPPPPVRAAPEPTPPEDDLVEEEPDVEHEASAEAAPVAGETSEDAAARGKRRRRRRGGRREDGAAPAAAAASEEPAPGLDPADAEQPALELPEGEPSDSPDVPLPDAAAEEARNRRRGRRGGRRRRRDTPEGETAPVAMDAEGAESPASFDAPEPAPSYAGPTPANPFGDGDMFDIFELAEQAEASRAAQAVPETAAPEPDAVADTAPEPAVEKLPEPAQAAAEPAMEIAAEAEPVAPAVVTAEPVVAETVPAEPVAEEPAPAEPVAAEPELALPPAPVPEEPPLANGHALPDGPTSAPLPPPVLVGDGTPAEKKRGWWRR